MKKKHLAILAVIAVTAGVALLILGPRLGSPPAKSRAANGVYLDRQGPYLILVTKQAAGVYARAIDEAKQLHPGAVSREFSPDALGPLASTLEKILPRYAVVFILPEELDANFAWRWLALTTQIDQDPFVDVRTGFITGESAPAAHAFVRRIGRFVAGETPLPRRLVDVLGPDIHAVKGSLSEQRGSFMIPVYGDDCELTTLSHGLEGMTAIRLKLLENAGFIHYGGHGFPDRVVDSLNGRWLRKIPLAPGVFFNGACYTGVTGYWFVAHGQRVRREKVQAGVSFCLGVLAGGPIAYFAALHSDHGIPVYQEMEFLAFSGAPLGAVIKYTHDGVILAAGGTVPVCEEWRDGMAAPDWTAADHMLKGTATRVLFGDPALCVGPAMTVPPFAIDCQVDGQSLNVTARLQNDRLRSTFTETYYNDLSGNNPFNDRALISCRLPQKWTAVNRIQDLSITSAGAALVGKILAHGVEQDAGESYLHVLIDLPSSGFQVGPLRNMGARVAFRVRRAE